MLDRQPVGPDQQNILVFLTQREVGVVVRPVVVRIVAIILSGGEDHHVPAGGNRDVRRRVGELPLVQITALIGEVPSLEVDRIVGGVVQFDPVGVVSLAVGQRRVVAGHELGNENVAGKQQTRLERFKKRYGTVVVSYTTHQSGA